MSDRLELANLPPGASAIALHLEFPGDALNFPNFNTVGTSLFEHVAYLALQMAGAGVIDLGSRGPLNSSHYLFYVQSAPAGLAALKVVLEARQWLPFAEMAFWDDRELIWRATYPENSASLFERHFDRESILRELEQILQQMRKP